MLKRIISRILFIVCLFSVSLLNGMERAESGNATELKNGTEVFVPSRLGNIQLYYGPSGFYVEKDGNRHDIQNCSVSEELRNISSEQLDYFLGRSRKVTINGEQQQLTQISPEELAQLNITKVVELNEAETQEFLSQCQSSYIEVNQESDGEYVLKARHRLPGGGIVKIMKAHAILQGGILLASIGGGVIATAVAGPDAGALVYATVGLTLEGALIWFICSLPKSRPPLLPL